MQAFTRVDIRVMCVGTSGVLDFRVFCLDYGDVKYTGLWSELTDFVFSMM